MSGEAFGAERPIYGVDPGFSGAIAIIWPDSRLLRVYDMPTFMSPVSRKTEINLPTLCELFREVPGEVWIERVHSRRGEGVTSAFRFGQGFGQVQAAAVAAGHQVRYVMPKTWKSYFALSADKERSVEVASARFPAAAHLFRGPRGGVLDGRAEAVLIGLYGQLEGVRPKWEEIGGGVGVAGGAAAGGRAA